MEQFRPITLDDGIHLKKILQKYGNALSSHAFPSLWLWQREMQLTLLLKDGFFAVKTGFPNQGGYFFPCGSEDKIKDFLHTHCASSGTRLFYVSAWGKAFLEREYAGQWTFIRQENADEYLYDIAGHMALRGGTYANMRTQVHRVEKNFHPHTALLHDGNLDDALSIIRTWEHGEHRFAGHAIRDDMVDEWAVIFREELGITGIIVYLDGKPMALAAGFPLSDTVLDLAVSKCSQNLQGVSYYAKRELLRMLPQYTVMNMEEDLGIPGLRAMKTALKPIGKNEMWEAVKR